MKIFAAFTCCVGLALSLASHAANSIAGQQKYFASCVACHDSPPDYRAVRGANAPDEIALALNSVSPMGQLLAKLSRQDIEDIAAYLGDIALNQNVLTTALRGAGSGTVVSSPGTIACGGLCSSSFELGSSVALHAMPRRGSAFAGWTGDCQGKRLGACVATMDRAKVVFARFERNGPNVDYSGLWWAGVGDAGWGMSISHGANSAQLFNVLYVHDAGGEPVWYVMPGGEWSGQFTRFRGMLYRPEGAPLDRYDAAQFQLTVVGEMTLNFRAPDSMDIDYQVHGITGRRSLVRPASTSASTAAGATLFGVRSPQLQSGAPAPAGANINGLWWGGLAENGWGVALAQAGDTVGAVWHTFDQAGRPTWLAMPGGTWQAGSHGQFRGELYKTRRVTWLSGVSAPASVMLQRAGSLAIDLAADGAMAAQYHVDDPAVAIVSQAKRLTPLPQ